MKKIISLILILVMALSLCACKKLAEAGSYKSIGIYTDTEYTLRNSGSFKSTDSEKGSYVADASGTIFFSVKDEQGFDFVKVGDYYYKRDIYGGFSEDTSEDMAMPLFNEEGACEQSFYKGEDKTYYGLTLNADKTYYASIENYDDEYVLIDKKEFTGTYVFEENILWLNYKNDKYPMIYDDATLYYKVVEKVEEK